MTKFIRISDGTFINIDKIISVSLNYYWHESTDGNTIILFSKVIFDVEGIGIIESRDNAFEAHKNNKQKMMQDFYKYESSFDLKEYFEINGITL
jgi:hypothetical protein